MIDLQTAFSEAENNIRVWRNRYTSQEYPHKILINIMYRAYTMSFVWEDFVNDKLPKFHNFNEAIISMERYYGQVATEKVNANLLNWLRTRANDYVGGCNYAFMEEVATDAERSANDLHIVETSYFVHLLKDKMVLYFIAMRLAGKTDSQAIEALTNYQVEMTGSFDYTSAKNAFGELIVDQYLAQKGISL
ncbi:MAG: hypothetical protein J6V20_04855 [Bacteroidaceae bacterium]|nr:hypothetical protein [Bacteroidaceae bacterium]